MGFVSLLSCSLWHKDIWGVLQAVPHAARLEEVCCAYQDQADAHADTHA